MLIGDVELLMTQSLVPLIDAERSAFSMVASPLRRGDEPSRTLPGNVQPVRVRPTAIVIAVIDTDRENFFMNCSYGYRETRKVLGVLSLFSLLSGDLFAE
jgi:hypothetical protein